MSPLESRYPTTAGPEYSKISEKDLKTNFMNIIEDLKEEITKYLKENTV